MIDLFRSYATFGEAPANGFGGEASPMFNSIESLFFDRGDELSILDKGCRSVAVVSIDSENIHSFKTLSDRGTLSWKTIDRNVYTKTDFHVATDL
jgi:hypothetical protein